MVAIGKGYELLGSVSRIICVTITHSESTHESHSQPLHSHLAEHTKHVKLSQATSEVQALPMVDIAVLGNARLVGSLKQLHSTECQHCTTF